MLAEQLLRFAEDFVDEYQKLNVIAAIKATSKALESRADATVYIPSADVARRAAQKIKNETRFSNYPADWRKSIDQSGFAPFLPGVVAEFLIRSLPADRDIAPPSAELIYLEQRCRHYLTIADHFALLPREFKVVPLDVPIGRVGILLTVPRNAIENEAKTFADAAGIFSNVIATVSEVVKEHVQPELLYCATSDPSICFSTAVGFAVAFIQFYSDVLQIIVHHHEILRLTGLWLNYGLSLPGLPEDQLRTEVDKAVAKLIGSYGSEARKSNPEELHSRMLIRMMSAVPLIQNGSRVSFVLTTTEKITTALTGFGEEEKKITHLAEITQKLEYDLDGLQKNMPVPAITSDRNSENE
jgi:hypothetical protein